MNRKSCKKLVFFSLLLIMLSINSIATLAGDEKLSISPTDAYRNMYAILQNKFDSSMVYFIEGEITFKRGSILTPLPFIKSNFSKEEQVGSSLTGVDPILSNKYQTSVFIPTAGDTLTFFRSVKVHKFNCRVTEGAGTPSDYIGEYPYNWMSVPGDIVDTTTFITRIEDVNDAAVFVNLDSVTVYPNPSSAYVSHGGTNVELYEHQVSIPPALRNRNSRIRLVVIRNGTSPLGLAAGFEFADIAFSAYRHPSNISKLDSIQADSLQRRYYLLAEGFMRNILSASNNWQAFTHLVLEDSVFTRIISDYFYMESDSTDPEIKYWFPKNRYLDSIGIIRLGFEDSTARYAVPDFYYNGFEKSRFEPDVKIDRGLIDGLSVYSVKLDYSAGGMILRIFSPEWMTDFTWYITDILGKEITTGIIWPGFHGAGEIIIPVPPSVVKGAYLLRLVDNQRGSATTLKITR